MKKIFFMVLLCLGMVITSSGLAQTAVFTLKSDKTVYATTETPILKASVYTRPDNSDYEFDITATLNNQSIATERVTDFQMFSMPKNLVIGTYTWAVILVMQDARYAKDLKATIKYYENKIIDIDTQLSTATDPQVIATLQQQKTNYTNIKLAAVSELTAIRTPVLAPQTLTFQVQ